MEASYPSGTSPSAVCAEYVVYMYLETNLVRVLHFVRLPNYMQR